LSGVGVVAGIPAAVAGGIGLLGMADGQTVIVEKAFTTTFDGSGTKKN